MENPIAPPRPAVWRGTIAVAMAVLMVTLVFGVANGAVVAPTALQRAEAQYCLTPGPTTSSTTHGLIVATIALGPAQSCASAKASYGEVLLVTNATTGRLVSTLLLAESNASGVLTATFVPVYGTALPSTQTVSFALDAAGRAVAIKGLALDPRPLGCSLGGSWSGGWLGYAISLNECGTHALLAAMGWAAGMAAIIALCTSAAPPAAAIAAAVAAAIVAGIGYIEFVDALGGQSGVYFALVAYIHCYWWWCWWVWLFSYLMFNPVPWGL